MPGITSRLVSINYPKRHKLAKCGLDSASPFKRAGHDRGDRQLCAAIHIRGSFSQGPGDCVLALSQRLPVNTDALQDVLKLLHVFA